MSMAATPPQDRLPSSLAPLPSAPADVGAIPEPKDRGEVVLDIKDLKTYFFTYDGVVKALDGVTFKIRRGETTGLVGETGCGKSVTAFSVTRLVSDPPGRVVGGQIHYRDANLLFGLESEAKFSPVPKTNRIKVKRAFRRIRANTQRMSAVRGRSISMIFQEPTQAMNPVFSISNQLGEVLLLHRGPEIVDGLLGATPRSPEVKAAVDELVEAGREDNRTAMRAAAVRVGEAVNLPTFGTQAFYIVRAAGAAADEAGKDVMRALRRLHVSNMQRRWLQSRRKLMMLDQAMDEVYLEELRKEHINRTARIRIRGQRTRERLSHFYYRLPGLRSRVGKPLKDELFWRTVGLLEGVSIANPVQVARGFPHELSGGMLQRVMIAMALSSEPDILIADEPTTALDVTIQAQILELMRDLKTRVGTAILLITHDLAVIAEVADVVCVMYAGVIVEQGAVHDVFRRPLHPYAQGLLASIPRLDQPDKELASIPGSVPDLIRPPSGCRFHPRCPYAMPICKETRPPMTLEGPAHQVACYLYKGPVAPS
jgi:peptide/nickel transport system ATP-binding protein